MLWLSCLISTAVAEGFGALRLTWTPPLANDDGSALTDLRGYNVYRMTQSGGPRTRVNTAIVQTAALLDEGLEDGRTYFYVVTAVNSRGVESVASVETSGTTLSRPAAFDLTPVLIAVAVIILIAILLILLLLWRRRKRGSRGEKRET